jgi:hypothetical protein
VLVWCVILGDLGKEAGDIGTRTNADGNKRGFVCVDKEVVLRGLFWLGVFVDRLRCKKDI